MADIPQPKSQHSALIVGAGPAGGLLAFLLAREGVAVTLIERHSDFNRVFRGEGLMPSGQDMFKQAGLWPQFDALPHSQFDRAEIFYKKKILARPWFHFPDGTPAPRFVSQPHMLEMLIAECEKFANFTFIKGLRVTRPIYENNRVIGVEVKDGQEVKVLRANYVFATDGRYSVLRKHAKLETPQNPEFFDIIWCKLPMPDFWKTEKIVRAYFGAGHLGLFIPSYDALQIGWVIRKGQYKNFKAMGIEGWITEMSHLVSDDMAQHLRKHQKDFTNPFLLDVVSDLYQDWSVPGLLLMGDAAHPMSPVGGQGINIALRDAVVAANHFISLFKKGANLGKFDPELFDQAALDFALERMPEVVAIKELQSRPPAILLGNGWWLDGLMLVIKASQKIGVAKYLFRNFRLENTPFAKGVTDVTLKKFE